MALDAVLHPASPFARRAAKDEQVAASRGSCGFREKDLTVRGWFERWFYAADSFYNRGRSCAVKGDLEGRCGITTRPSA